jgi:hypothetical protein
MVPVSTPLLKDFLVASKLAQLSAKLLMSIHVWDLCKNNVFNSFQCVSQSTVAGSHGKRLLSLVRSCHAVSKVLGQFALHQRWMSKPPCGSVILPGLGTAGAHVATQQAQWCFTVVLICIALKTGVVLHLFVCFLASCVSLVSPVPDFHRHFTNTTFYLSKNTFLALSGFKVRPHTC